MWLNEITIFLVLWSYSLLDTYQDIKEFLLSITQIILSSEFNVSTYLLAFKKEIQLHVRFDGLVVNQVCVRFERKPFVVLYVEVIYVVHVTERFNV
jgi:hypothetical protein